MSASVIGTAPRTWRGEMDKEGYRTYHASYLVKTTSVQDGPAAALTASGLPAIGSIWNIGADIDVWAVRWPDTKATIHQEKEGDGPRIWRVDCMFTSRPFKDCLTQLEDDPLLSPQKVSGSFVKYIKEASIDRNGNLLKSSSHEPLMGLEFDANRPNVHIEQNVALLGLGLCSSMIDTVNDATLWGLGARKVKFSNLSWERKMNKDCDYYYTRIFDFDIDFKTFDRTVEDSGLKVLSGGWNKTTGSYEVKPIDDSGTLPDADNPQHFMRYKDIHDETARVMLNGYGLPADTSVLSGTGTGAGSGSIAEVDVEYYPESNLLLLGIPTTF